MSHQSITRADLSNALHQEVGLSRYESGKLVDEVLSMIEDALVTNRKMKMSGFGSFTVRQKKERTGRNPKTGIEAVVSARNVVKFRPALELKRLVNVRKK